MSTDTSSDQERRGGDAAVGGEGLLIRVVLAQRLTLLRTALAALLSREEDIDVVAELTPETVEVADEVRRLSPHVLVLDSAVFGPAPPPDTAVVNGSLVPRPRDHSVLYRLYDELPDCNLLVLVDAVSGGAVGDVLRRCPSRLGFVAQDAPAGRLVEAVRQMAAGQVYLGPSVAVAAVMAKDNPLTPREREILALAAEGVPVQEIAAVVCLSIGTVRNHLSRVLSKTGARTRIEAIRIVQRSGWL